METSLKKKKQQDPREYKHWLVPLLVLSLLAALILWDNIKNVTRLPSKDWSRSIELPIESGEYLPFLSEKDGHTLVFTAGKTGVQAVELDKTLNVVKQKKIKTTLDDNARVWSDGSTFISTYQKDLILLKDGEKSVLAENVELMAPSKSIVYYSRGSSLFAYTPDSGKTVEIKKFEAPVTHLSGNSTSDSVLATETSNTNQNLYYVTKNEQEYKVSALVKYFKLSSETLFGFRFAEEKGEVHVIYTRYSTAGGGQSYFPYYGHAPADKLEEMKFNKMLFLDKKTATFVEKPTHTEIFVKDGVPQILFSARAMLASNQKSVSIFSATRGIADWDAERISTTDNFNRFPATIDGENVFWLRGMQKDGNRLYASSHNPVIKEQSQEMNRNDLIIAGSDTFSSVLVGFFAMSVAMLWIVPTILLFMVLYATNSKAVDDERPWVFWVPALLFTAIQVYGIQRLFNESFYATAPSYLTFSGSSYVIPVAASVLSLLILKAAKGIEWGVLKSFAYFMGMNFVIALLLVGVYVY
ncbi:hypothetical protein ACFFJY_00930 [Fictibacillus aquaticus]|uniref:Uncharacterized protein n=1 Tax=Fictibacillus aquaticus TaxID=2021314 RepID=A0A235F7Q7_9BACL|nr:hypothetical protein [Fictibacillus aquaticus]OYD57288.1 hypothetical protein CGZ90_11410 [Fictibacillus aquaticus]